MTVHAQLDEAVSREIVSVIRERFNLDSASTIEVRSIEVDTNEQKIHIELMITTNARPEALAKSYLGLTNKVRETLGSDWSGFFPVITPQINPTMHA